LPASRPGALIGVLTRDGFTPLPGSLDEITQIAF
jgi:hypothetical protein